jgi:transposase InsO family protein
VCDLDTPSSLAAISRGPQARQDCSISSGIGATQVSSAVYAEDRGKPGPIGPAPELVAAIVEMKRRNPGFGYQRIADQISLAFDLQIDKDLVRRVLAKHYRPTPGSNGPSWLTFLGHSKDSLWSVDMFRCESLLLKTHWVMLIMDQCTRRIIGFGVHSGVLDGPAVCRMFNRVVAGRTAPTYLSFDNDPLFRYRQWQANLRILGVAPVTSVPYVPLSHPFVERLIGTVRREFLDQVPFWSANDLEQKLLRFRDYYNQQRTHRSLGGSPPAEPSERSDRKVAHLHDYRWKKHCRGLYQLPEAA